MANVNNVNIDKIKALAKEQGLTMTYLCRQIGKRATFLSDVRLKSDSIDENELSFIAEKLNTTIEYLTDQTEQKEKPIIIDDEREAVIYKLNVLMNQMEIPQLERFIEIVRFAALSDSDFEKLKQFAQIFLTNSPQ